MLKDTKILKRFPTAAEITKNKVKTNSELTVFSKNKVHFKDIIHGREWLYVKFSC